MEPQFKIWSDEYLLQACLEAHGNVEKELNILGIANKIGAVYISNHLKEIINHLAENKYIYVLSRDSFSVTYIGIYYIAKTKKYTLNQLGILSNEDIKNILGHFNRWIYKESLKNEGIVDINDIKKEFKKIIGDSPIIQLIDILKNKGAVTRIDKDHIRVKTSIQS